MANDPHDVIWVRDEHGNPQQTTRVNAETLGWKQMTKSDFDKTFPSGDEPPAADTPKE